MFWTQFGISDKSIFGQNFNQFLSQLRKSHQSGLIFTEAKHLFKSLEIGSFQII